MQFLKIRAAAAYAGCSGRFVERLQASGGEYVVPRPPKAGGGYDQFKIRRDSSGRIDADQLKALVTAQRLSPYRQPGRAIGTRYPQKGRRRTLKKIMTANWRLGRCLTLISRIDSTDHLKGIAAAAFQRAKALGLKLA